MRLEHIQLQKTNRVLKSVVYILRIIAEKRNVSLERKDYILKAKEGRHQFLAWRTVTAKTRNERTDVGRQEDCLAA